MESRQWWRDTRRISNIEWSMTRSMWPLAHFKLQEISSKRIGTSIINFLKRRQELSGILVRTTKMPLQSWTQQTWSMTSIIQACHWISIMFWRKTNLWEGNFRSFSKNLKKLLKTRKWLLQSRGLRIMRVQYPKNKHNQPEPRSSLALNEREALLPPRSSPLPNDNRLRAVRVGSARPRSRNRATPR